MSTGTPRLLETEEVMHQKFDVLDSYAGIGRMSTHAARVLVTHEVGTDFCSLPRQNE